MSESCPTNHHQWSHSAGVSLNLLSGEKKNCQAMLSRLYYYTIYVFCVHFHSSASIILKKNSGAANIKVDNTLH
uniref:Uncharacterized protein n=1 Tax=Arion vulgaris TaxID=1028688 RepID=A0A0B7AXE8_9EUPU